MPQVFEIKLASQTTFGINMISNDKKGMLKKNSSTGYFYTISRSYHLSNSYEV